MTSVLDLIGETPLIEVTGFDRGPCRLFLKLESANPSGSIKDRPARAMIEAAEADGRLKPGGTIVEATAGNTGLGLALVGARKGYRIVLVVPDKMAREKILHCRPWAPKWCSRAPTSAAAMPTTIRISRRRSRSARPAHCSSINSPIPPIRRPTRPRPARRFFARCTATSMPSWSVSARAAR
jgi:hypothetical protein